MVWTHAGLRSNEIARLRVGCTREQSEDVVDQSGNVVPAGRSAGLMFRKAKLRLRIPNRSAMLFISTLRPG